MCGMMDGVMVDVRVNIMVLYDDWDVECVEMVVLFGDDGDVCGDG